jgi:2-C-methyl-D-erythritol 4-phosphate cytidylyltransferase
VSGGDGQPTVAAILVAAGAGERLGVGVPKAFVQVAGQTLLEHASIRFVHHPAVRDVIAVVPSAMIGPSEALMAGVAVIAGGATRQESVARGLARLAADVDLVLVHDVARPFVPADVIDRVIAALSAGADAAVPTVPVTDTIRRIDEAGELAELVDRSRLLAMQTPQGFRRLALQEAHSAATESTATDDAALVEARGGHVVAVDGDASAFKITQPLDLALAELVAMR